MKIINPFWIWLILLLIISLSLKIIKIDLPFIIKDILFLYEKLIKQFLNYKFFISFCIAWFITNGYIYVIICLGVILHNPILKSIGFTILGIYWLPFVCEKPITFAIAVFIYKKLFHKEI